MSSNAEGLNYFPFLTQQQQSPPSSSRTMPSPCGSGVTFTGGQTTRRSLPKNLHGNYEGDFSMFTSRTNQAASGSLVDQILEAGLDLRLDQHFEARTIEEHLDDEVDEIVDEEIRAKIAEVQLPIKEQKLPSPPKPSLWQRYKGHLFSTSQYKMIDDALVVIQQNLVVRKVSYVGKLTVLILGYVLRLLLFNFVMRFLKTSWSASFCRSTLRKASRRLLWCMTLAKCGDIQYFGLIMLLSPIVFVVAALGCIFALYCVIKQGIQSFARHMRYIDFEVPRIED